MLIQFAYKKGHKFIFFLFLKKKINFPSKKKTCETKMVGGGVKMLHVAGGRRRCKQHTLWTIGRPKVEEGSRLID